MKAVFPAKFLSWNGTYADSSASSDGQKMRIWWDDVAESWVFSHLSPTGAHTLSSFKHRDSAYRKALKMSKIAEDPYF